MDTAQDVAAPEQNGVVPLEDAEMDDLFGNDDNVVNGNPAEVSPTDTPAADANVAPAAAPSDGLTAEEIEHRKEMEYEELEEEQDIVYQTINEVYAKLPNIPLPRSSDGNHWTIKLPNYVTMDMKPFNPDTYTGAYEDEDVRHSQEKSMTTKLRVDNTLRWRWGTDEYGDNVRRSNGRIIRWSDGSLSFKLGKELFDIHQTIDTSASNPRSGSQAASQTGQPKAEGLSYLIAQHRKAQLLQANAPITGQMSLRPTSSNSETHKLLVRAVGQKHNKVARLRMAPDPVMDPERQMALLAKETAKKSKRTKHDDDDLGMGVPNRRRSYSRRRGHDLYSDDDEDEDTGFGGAASSSSPQKKKKLDADDEDEEDDFIVNDEDSDEDESSSRRRRSQNDTVEDEDDDLEQAEARLKARKKGKNEDAVESEDPESEEEDAAKVRRAGARRQRIDFGDDSDDE